ncbi:MAG: zinc ribbon domain-containing protein [Lysobacteraceae bacterium]|nr:MAG: zinc ribbon domain-containing protein [Xanthomonadaceae bacterium]
MPIYAFECSACCHQFDRLQKLSDPDPTECPACGAAQVRRQLTAPAFRLSGSGWYETDFKKDGDKKRNLSDSGDAAGPEAKATAASEGKSEAKSEAKPDATSSSKPETKSEPASAAKPAEKPTAVKSADT